MEELGADDSEAAPAPAPNARRRAPRHRRRPTPHHPSPELGAAGRAA